MRYIIRRSQPEHLDEIIREIPDLNDKLGQPANDLRCDIMRRISEHRHYQYQFSTRKTANGWIWICTTIELVAENEKGLLELMKLFNYEPVPSYINSYH